MIGLPKIYIYLFVDKLTTRIHKILKIVLNQILLFYEQLCN